MGHSDKSTFIVDIFPYLQAPYLHWLVVSTPLGKTVTTWDNDPEKKTEQRV